jgi:hypothetical protein
MDADDRFDVEALLVQLRRSFRHGARAAQLVSRTPELVDLLRPARKGGTGTVYDRALAAEREIGEAVAGMDPPADAALGYLLCLRPGTLGVRLERRREQAARLFEVTPETFRRRDRHETMLVLGLGLELYRRRTAE